MAMETETDFVWVPAQDMPRLGTDMRRLAANTIRGYKVGPSSTANTTKTQPRMKRKRNEADDEQQAADTEMQVEPAGVESPPDLKKMRTTCNRDVTGVTSSRAWKVPAARRSSAAQKPSGKSWDVKMQEKQQRKLNQIAAQTARQEYKDMLRKKRQALEAAKERKLENRKENDRKHGVVVSAATARKFAKSKKLRKQLVAA